MMKDVNVFKKTKNVREKISLLHPRQSLIVLLVDELVKLIVEVVVGTANPILG